MSVTLGRLGQMECHKSTNRLTKVFKVLTSSNFLNAFPSSPSLPSSISVDAVLMLC